MSACLAILVLGLGSGSRVTADDKLPDKDAKDAVVIGMPKTLFHGMPEFMVRAGSGPFLKLMKDATGSNGTLVIVPDPMTLAKQMDEGKIHIGVFQGHEFAWAMTKHKKLTPIAVADPLNPVQAFCVVSWDSKAKNVGDLKAEKLSLPPIHRDYCEMFLAKQKEAHLKGVSFAAELKAATAEDAIFDVIDGKCGLTVVDATALNGFRKIHPGPSECLKVLCQSDPFPNACIAVKKDEMNPKTVEKFREALLKATELPGGRPMLATWKLKGFIKVPDNYEALLKACEKAYPLPPELRVSLDK
jgi:ABC-type phosphate/phosphonate transport system substrate-binding protein